MSVSQNSPDGYRHVAAGVLNAHINAIRLLIPIVCNKQFQDLAEELATMSGKCIVTGVGKSAIAARKIAATLATVGTQAMFLDPIGMFHGELGMLRTDDIVIMISSSGETEELLRLVEPLKSLGVHVVPFVGSGYSTLGQIDGSISTECQHDPYFKVPTTTSAAVVALGDALAIVVALRHGFTNKSLAITHPGGTIGREAIELDSPETVDR